MLEDIAILTGGNVITEELGRKLDSVEIEDLGRALKVRFVLQKKKNYNCGWLGRKSCDSRSC